MGRLTKDTVKKIISMSFTLKSSCYWSNCNVIYFILQSALDVENRLMFVKT